MTNKMHKKEIACNRIPWKWFSELLWAKIIFKKFKMYYLVQSVLTVWSYVTFFTFKRQIWHLLEDWDELLFLLPIVCFHVLNALYLIKIMYMWMCIWHLMRMKWMRDWFWSEAWGPQFSWPVEMWANKYITINILQMHVTFIFSSFLLFELVIFCGIL
jgi:hypothetical protein